jgi:hypothetical protein
VKQTDRLSGRLFPVSIYSRIFSSAQNFTQSFPFRRQKVTFQAALILKLFCTSFTTIIAPTVSKMAALSSVTVMIKVNNARGSKLFQSLRVHIKRNKAFHPWFRTSNVKQTKYLQLIFK